MNTIKVATWEDFESELSTKVAAFHAADPDAPPLLFRGQSHSCWPLDTTLARVTRAAAKPVSLRDYYHLILNIAPEIETITGLRWDDLPSQDELPHLLTYEHLHVAFTRCEIPALYYILYLRHYGFPSPLLDWTRSPYIAAYFAFAESNGVNNNDVAIYVLAENTEGVNIQGCPHIYSLQRNRAAHKRHFVQQSAYTICTAFLPNGDGWSFASYDDALGDQYSLDKYIIPSCQTTNVLKHLNQVNLNAASLFGSYESLMDTLSFREFYLR